MPWFPEFVTAVELARKDAREAGHADPVAQYVRALQRGDARALETAWPGEVIIHDPRAGEVRGHRELRRFVRRSQSLLAEYRARVETVAATRVDRRAVLELLVHLTVDGREVGWPTAIIAESRDDRSAEFRSYFSQLPVYGQRRLRPAVLKPGNVHPGDVVGRHQAALETGDVETIVDTFEPDGYVREPIGDQYVHRGATELRSFYARCFSAGGGIGLEHCTVTDDGGRCAVEFNCVRWGRYELAPQAGIVIYERGSLGLLAAVRVYDDLEAPFASELAAPGHR